MEKIIIFVSAVTFIAIVLEMYRIRSLVKNQAEIVLLQKQLIDKHEEKELIYKEMIEKYELLNKNNEIIIANLKK